MSSPKLAERLAQLEGLGPKQLRTLRNSLNNRLQAFSEKGEDKVKALSESHRLHGLDPKDCQELLKAVRSALKDVN